MGAARMNDLIFISCRRTLLALTHEEFKAARLRATELTASRSAEIDTGVFLSTAEVIEAVGLSRSGIYDKMQRGLFPQQVVLNSRRKKRVAWRSGDIARWLLERAASR